jgi:hypothetical protein
MTGHTAIIDGLLAEVFHSCKINTRRSVHTAPVSYHYHPIVRGETWLTWHSGQVAFDYQPGQELVAPPMAPWTTDLPSWRAVRSYRRFLGKGPHLRWWLAHDPYRWSPSWGVRKMLGDLCTVPGSISFSHYHQLADVRSIERSEVYCYNTEGDRN